MGEAKPRLEVVSDRTLAYLPMFFWSKEFDFQGYRAVKPYLQGEVDTDTLPHVLCCYKHHFSLEDLEYVLTEYDIQPDTPLSNWNYVNPWMPMYPEVYWGHGCMSSYSLLYCFLWKMCGEELWWLRWKDDKQKDETISFLLNRGFLLRPDEISRLLIRCNNLLTIHEAHWECWSTKVKLSCLSRW
jgi:hypothetical protein